MPNGQPLISFTPNYPLLNFMLTTAMYILNLFEILGARAYPSDYTCFWDFHERIREDIAKKKRKRQRWICFIGSSSTNMYCTFSKLVVVGLFRKDSVLAFYKQTAQM